MNNRERTMGVQRGGVSSMSVPQAGNTRTLGRQAQTADMKQVTAT